MFVVRWLQDCQQPADQVITLTDRNLSFLPLIQFTFVDEAGKIVTITDRVRIKLTLPYEPNVTVRYFNGISIEEGDPKFQVCDVAFLDLCNNAIDFTICRWKQMTVVFYNVQTFLCWKKL